MIADLKPYPEYQDSGSRWLAEVPSHWEVRNLRTLIRSRNERNRADLPLLSVAREKGVFVRSLTDADENHNVIPEDLSNYKVARVGSLVVNKMKAWQGSMGIAPCDGIVSPAYFVFDFAIANRAFGQALLRSKPYVAHFGQASDGVRVGQWDLTIAGMRQIPVLVPPLDEQTAIVRFLDWANGRLERAIRAKRKVIALLNEQKQAIIHRAVTRGLDPTVPLKPSGFPCLGDIPQHWDVRQLGRFITLQRGFDITQDKQEAGSIPVVSSGGVSSFHNKFTSPGPGVIVGRKGSVGTIHFIAGPYWPHDTTLWVKDFGGNDPRYIYYVLSHLDLKRFDTGSANPTLNRNVVHPELVAFPPYHEQELIARNLDVAVNNAQKAISHLDREIELLREYRTRLVADVVTGKLDVREVAERLPAAEEPEPMGDVIVPEDEIEAEDEVGGA
jgi:type I restriction enzyme S subunit